MNIYIYTFNWSSYSSAGTIIVVETTKERALEVAKSYFDDVTFDDEQECVTGAHVLVTTENRPI